MGNWPVLLGLCALIIPSVWKLSNTLWQNEDQAHGPIVACVVLWLFWGLRNQLATIDIRPSAWGWPLVLIALFCYIVGQSQLIYILGVGSFIPLVAGLLLVSVGWRGLRLCAFPLIFMLFLIPLPGFIVDTVTAALKQQVSVIAEAILYAAGYPIGRSGVTLTVGPYELLVADACSGLNSMFSLFALGVLYLYLQGYRSKARNLVLFLSIAPVAFFANIVRVMILVVITYYYGDAAGQGFIHGFAGLILFMVALIIIFLLDRFIPNRVLSRAVRGGNG
jgi:exosortase B